MRARPDEWLRMQTSGPDLLTCRRNRRVCLSYTGAAVKNRIVWIMPFGGAAGASAGCDLFSVIIGDGTTQNLPKRIARAVQDTDQRARTGEGLEEPRHSLGHASRVGGEFGSTGSARENPKRTIICRDHHGRCYSIGWRAVDHRRIQLGQTDDFATTSRESRSHPLSERHVPCL